PPLTTSVVAETLRPSGGNAGDPGLHPQLQCSWEADGHTALGHLAEGSLSLSDAVDPPAALSRHGSRQHAGPPPHRASCVAEPKTSPRVFPLSLKTSDPAGQVVIACLVQGFFPPEPVTVTWSPSKEGASIRNFPAVKSASGNLYTTSSQLTLPASQCPDGTSLQCHVEHYSVTSPAVSVPCRVPDDCPPPECSPCNEPHLSLHKPALEDLLLGSNASITCTLSGLKNPKGALFSWTPSGGKEAIQKPPERDSCGCCCVSSVLPGCAEPWNRGENFSCTATHPELKTPKTDTISKVLELALNELVSLTCLVRGFSPEDVLVRWLQGSQELSREKYLTWGPLQEPDQSVPTFATTSVLRVSAEDWKQGEKFSCMVGHEALPLAFTQKTIDRLAGKPTHVNVSVVMSDVEGVCY
uniref:Ig-like domain-containing protein n=1 Tax=Panthera tigris altaica TaxID=74533 RepID=A0A8C9KE83_PANTA